MIQKSAQSDWKPHSSAEVLNRVPDALASAHPRVCGLIVNADDWGRDTETTDRILDCLRHGSLSSTSGMVFMEDSERASRIAIENDVDVGLHLNFTTPFSASIVPSQLLQVQQRLTKFLRSSRLAQVLFHPGLTGVFRYVVKAQIEEYRRLYGTAPKRIDGHHHMHLCANVLFGGLLPVGTIVRRNFSFEPGEKSELNRMYRNLLDRMIEKRHPVTNYFFSIEPIGKMERLRKIVNLANTSLVELETHPVNIEEFRFLTGGEFFRQIGSVKIAPRYEVGQR
jgi:predicted glycoside hydrolase/deacetylase ChbG (UPF0249 family)